MLSSTQSEEKPRISGLLSRHLSGSGLRSPLRWAWRYGLAVVMVAAAMGLRLAVEAWVGPGLPTYITFFPAVMVVALVAGFGPGVLATLLSAYVVAVWIIPPIGHFHIESPIDRIGLVIFTAMGLFMSLIAELFRRLREKVAAYERELLLRESQEILRRQAELIDPARAKVIAQEMQRVLRERGGMDAAAVEPTVESLGRVADISGAVVAGVGLLVLAGWILGLESFKSVLPGLATMKANTALSFLFAGIALALRQRRLVWLASAGLVCAVAGLTLAEYISGWDFGIDQLLFLEQQNQHTQYPGRMAQATALGFLLGGVSLLLLHVRARPALTVQQACALAAGLTGMVAVFGYIYDAQILYKLAGYSSMALHTALAFVLLAVGLVFARSDGLSSVVTTPGPGTKLMRQLFPATLLMPVMLGWLIHTGHINGLYGEGMDTALFVLLMTVILSSIVWWSVHSLNKADAVRRETESHLRNLTELMNHAHEPMIVREPDGVIRAWNRGAELLYGWTAVEALGQNKLTLLHTDPQLREEIDRQLESTGHWEGELIQTTRDSRRVTVMSRQTASRTGYGRILILESNLDITERKLADEALKRSEEFNRRIIASSKDCIKVLDLDGHILSLSEGGQRLLEIEDVTPFLGLSWIDFWKEDIEGAQRVVAAAVGGEVGCFNGYCPTAKGTPKWWEVFVSPIMGADHKIENLLAVSRDITERLRTEKALKESEFFFKESQRAASIGSYKTDLITGRWESSEVLDTIFGIDSTYTRSIQGWLELVHPDDRDMMDHYLREEVIAKRNYFSKEYRIVRINDGETRWVYGLGEVRFDGNGIPLSLIGTIQDITERKQAEESLTVANRQIQSIIDNTPAIVYAFDLEKRFVLANITIAKLLNSTPAQLIGNCRHDFMPQADADWHEANDRKVIEAGRALDFEEQSKLSGRTITWLTTKFPLLDTDGRIYAVGGISTDITERKQAEVVLRDSEERHRLLAETMLQGVVHQNADGTIISMNPAAERILGKSREDFLGNSSVDVEHHTIRENGEIFPGMEHPTMVALRTGLPVRGVVMGVFNPKVEEYRWIGIDAVPVFRQGENVPSEVYSVFGDITDRKNAEMVLQESEQRIQQALHVSRSFTFEWMPVSDLVIRSASCAAILNLDGDEAVNDTGEHYFQCIHPDDRARFVKILRELTPTANSYMSEYRYVCNNGSEVTLEETGQASFDATGRMLRLVGVTTDITARKQAESMLKKMNQELEIRVAERTNELAISMNMLRTESAERIQTLEVLREKEQMLIQQSRQAAMGEMIGNIAHQWRQPLNSLGLYTQMLGMYYGTSNFNKEFLDDSIAKSMGIIKHMSKTIDDFRDYFRPEREKSDFYLIKAITNTLSLLEGNFHNPKIAIDYIEHDNPVINGYQNEFSQVLLNILNNARDAIIEREIADGKIRITVCNENSCAVVTVADNAGGIPEEIIHKVFDPYFTTKGPQVGTGIGLFMSKTIIEKNMGGRLTVRNTDSGAEFRIEVEHGTQN